MNKKVIIIILIIILVLIGVGLWFVFSKGGLGGEEGTSPGNFFGNLFPFGGDSDDRPTSGSTEGGGGDTPSSSENGVILQLRQLTTEAVAGAMATSSGGTINVRYLERATGNIYEINLQTLQKDRLTNTTIIGVHNVVWHGDGSSLILRYLNENDVIKTFAGTISSSADSGENIGRLDGIFLDDDIPYITTSPDKTKILLLSQIKTGISFITAEFNGGNREPVAISPFSQWIPQWFDDGTISITTKASALAPGFLYFVDLSTGFFEKVIGDINGLTTLVNKTGEIILYSESNDRHFTLNAITLDERIKIQPPLSTLPEKCVWSTVRTSIAYCGVPTTITPGNYPDVWYQGLVSFSDNIWEIDVEKDTVKFLISLPTAAREEIDLINPVLSDNEEYLIFTNKKDSTLWSLKLQ